MTIIFGSDFVKKKYKKRPILKSCNTVKSLLVNLKLAVISSGDQQHILNQIIYI